MEAIIRANSVFLLFAVDIRSLASNEAEDTRKCRSLTLTLSPILPVHVIYSHLHPPCLLSLYSKRGFDVRSFGTGTHVKLPGPAPDKPNVYDFKTTYEQMYNDLVRKDKELYPQQPHNDTLC